MGEAGPHESQDWGSEEKTEPFSQSEIESRLNGSRLVETDVDVNSNVPLDNLVVPPDKGIRILVLPRTRNRSVSPGIQDNCEWLALRAEVEGGDQAQHKVLAVTQTSKDIKWTVRIPGEGGDRPPLWCELYYDPFSDNQIFRNRSDMPIELCRVSQQLPTSPELDYVLNPDATQALRPGTWQIRVRHTEVLDFRIVEKRPVTLLRASKSESCSGPGDLVNSSGKRFFGAHDNSLSPGKKPRVDDDGVIVFLPAKADPLVFPLPRAGKELVPSTGHALLNMDQNDEVEIPGGCEMDEYRIVKRHDIAPWSPLSSVFKAEHSKVPDGTVTVKVLKTRATTSGNGGAANENERNVIRQADVWLREFESHAVLEHEGIVRLFGGDARYLSLYMEHVDAKDLSAEGHWCSPAELFVGDRSDALRILRDTASALNYMHKRGLLHNDIKPGNILYSRDRGAVLCDFGLSSSASHATTGGTPYYIPPEFIGRKQRGAPSDVWALGITMLYVLRNMAFPDARSRRKHPRPLYWMIADVNRPPQFNSAAQSSAVAQMQTWLAEVSEARSKLGQDTLERLVFDMLAPSPTHRITMPKLLAQLFSAPDALAI